MRQPAAAWPDDQRQWLERSRSRPESHSGHAVHIAPLPMAELTLVSPRLTHRLPNAVKDVHRHDVGVESGLTLSTARHRNFPPSLGAGCADDLRAQSDQATPMQTTQNTSTVAAAALEGAWSEKANALGIHVFTVGPRLRMFGAEQLAGRIMQLASEGSRNFIVDLSPTEDVDVRALAPLVGVAGELGERHGRLSIVLDPLLVIFQAEGLERLFEVAVTEEAAVARMSHSATTL